MLVLRFLLDLQAAHQKKALGPENGQGAASGNFSFGSIDFVRALGSLTAHVDGSSQDIPDVEWDEPREVEEDGVPRPDETDSLNVTGGV